MGSVGIMAKILAGKMAVIYIIAHVKTAFTLLVLVLLVCVLVAGSEFHPVRDTDPGRVLVLRRTTAQLAAG